MKLDKWDYEFIRLAKSNDRCLNNYLNLWSERVGLKHTKLDMSKAIVSHWLKLNQKYHLIDLSYMALMCSPEALWGIVPKKELEQELLYKQHANDYSVKQLFVDPILDAYYWDKWLWAIITSLTITDVVKIPGLAEYYDECDKAYMRAEAADSKLIDC